MVSACSARSRAKDEDAAPPHAARLLGVEPRDSEAEAEAVEADEGGGAARLRERCCAGCVVCASAAAREGCDDSAATAVSEGCGTARDIGEGRCGWERGR